MTVRDPAFHDRSRQKQLHAPTHLIRDLTTAAAELISSLWAPPSPVRMLTVTAIHLVPEEDAYEQVDLFSVDTTPNREKQERLEATMAHIRNKYGAGSICFGSTQLENEEDPLP